MSGEADRGGVNDAAQRTAASFAKGADTIRRSWEPWGYTVHVDTNERRIVISPRSTKKPTRGAGA